MAKKIILDLCGGTGSWSKPYRESELYDVRVITLPDFDVTSDKVIEDCVALKPYGILAAPPCTEFSIAKQFHGKGNYQHNFAEGLKPVIACLKIIAMTQPKFWAMENPNGFLKMWLGKPTLIFEPWQFGDKYQKTTLLWGKFNKPEFLTDRKPKNIKKFSMLHSKEIAPEFFGIYDRTVRRSITPQGFARAFYRLNK